MFLLRQPSEDEAREFLRARARDSFSYPEVGESLRGAPGGYTLDHNRVLLGSGAATFARAREAVRRWSMFDIGWVRLLPENAPIEIGSTVAIVVRHLGFWSMSSARIVYTIDEPKRFGFAYGTLREHAERGEERFSVERLEDGTVWYDLLAFSRPEHWLARIGYPISRQLQKRFARDSKAAMTRAVQGREQLAQDLVCGKEVPEDSRFFTEYDEKKYEFCSAECKRKFDDHPDQLIQEKAKEDLGLS